MRKRSRLLAMAVLGVLLLSMAVLGIPGGDAQSGLLAAGNAKVVKSRDAAAIRALMDKRVTNEDRLAAAARAKAKGAAAAPVAAPPQGGTPNYFGPEPNWAQSPQPTVNPTTGVITGGIRKFIDALPKLGVANGIGQKLVVAVPDTVTYPGADYYEIALVEFTEKMHTDLNPTKLRGYVQIDTAQIPDTANRFALTYPSGAPILNAAGAQVYGVDKPHYLGASIVATKGKPVRVKFTNYLPTGSAGDLFLPVDTTNMGAGQGPLGTAVSPGKPVNYTQNRASVHLHGGVTPWISDGTPHQWITPAGENTDYPKGVSVQNVPDMPDPGPGSMTFFYSNQQSARLMFYHDHAYGITRLNVYAGEASGYILTDPTEQDLVTRGIVPAAANTLPLIIQDKTFVDPATVLVTDPTWPFAVSGARNDLWYPHVYMPNQNPNDASGINALGRWDYGPWINPPWIVTNPPTSVGGVFQPNLPKLSATMEAFHDTPLVNGTPYPTLTVDPKAYRFKILNAANDRFWNLQLYESSTIVGSIKLTGGGSNYTTVPQVTIARGAGDTTGKGATALATVDTTVGSPTYRQVIAIDLQTVGSGYTVDPIVTISTPAGGTAATATAKVYTGATEVGMVPALPGADSFPVAWTEQTLGQPADILDGRWGGVPDPAKIGPSFIQIGNEGGFLPAPAVIENVPLGYDRDPKSATIGNVKEKSLFIAPAERADVIVDFSAYAGKTLILYNDSTAAVPAADSRLDYYTNDQAQLDIGGTVKTIPGYGPATRTIMQIKVNAVAPVPFNAAALDAEFASTPSTPGVFARSQDKPIVPQSIYNSAYNASYPANTAKVFSTSLTFTPIGQAAPVTIPFKLKTIIELFENTYGRMTALLGVEIPALNATNVTAIPYGYIDPFTEILDDSINATQIGALGDGTQIWRIVHNGVDTHPIHFHLFNVQVINRVDLAGVVSYPDPNEMGWKETVRMNPIEDVFVALRPVAPQLPFGVPDSVRPLDPTRPIGSTMGFTNINPDGTPTVPPVTNQLVNLGWEYVWHCHILSHEEMDMMRAMKFNVGRALAAVPALTGGRGAGTNVDLTWTDSTPFNYTTQLPAVTIGNPANEIGYRIERAVGGGAYTLLATVLANLTTYTDPGAATNTAYNYRVTAFNAAGNSVSNVLAISGGGGGVLTRIEQTNTSIVYSPAWSTFSTASASGGSYARTTTANATATIPFNGTRLDVIATKGTTLGTVDISVDGGAVTTVNLNSATVLYKQTIYSTGTLAAGMHWVTLKRSAGNIAGRYISLDAVDVAGTLIAKTHSEQTAAQLVYVPNPWATFATASAWGGSYARSSVNPSTVTITFNGIKLDWIATKGTTMGTAKVSLDGGAAVTVNLAAAAVAYKQMVWSTGFITQGVHTVVITRDPLNAAGKFISLDAVDAWGTLQ